MDSRSLQAIQKSLTYLDVSGSGLSSLNGLECLSNLEYLDLSTNRLSNESELLNFLSRTAYLKYLHITENPLSKYSKINERIITAARNLGT